VNNEAWRGLRHATQPLSAAAAAAAAEAAMSHSSQRCRRCGRSPRQPYGHSAVQSDACMPNWTPVRH